MAKVKGAKQRITEYLKAKGLDAAEIKDAFDELDSADVDLTTLASQLSEASDANQKWNQWYQAAAPEMQAIARERDELKQKMTKLAEAGFNLSDSGEHTKDKIEAGEYVSPAEFQKFKTELAGATSQVMKGLTRVAMRHLKEFNEELDLDEVEKLVAEKGYSVEDAYDFYARPKREAKQKELTDAEIARRVQEGIQDALSKQGIRGRRKRADEVEHEPIKHVLSKKEDVPTDTELLDAFVSGLNSDLTH